MRKIIYFIFAVLLVTESYGMSSNYRELQPHEKKEIVSELLFISGVKCLNNDIATCTQQWKRSPYVERWELTSQGNSDIIRNKERILYLFGKLGLFDVVDAKEKEYDYGIILGATVESMRVRIKHLIKQLEQEVKIKQLLFLVSDRILNKQLESEEVLFNINNSILPLKKDTKFIEDIPFTEAEAAKFLYTFSDLPQKLKEIPVTFIIASSKFSIPGRLSRANTADTVLKWMEEGNKPGKALFVSNIPHILYQNAVIKKNINKEYIIETIGGKEKDAKPEETNIMLLFDMLAKWIENDSTLLNT